MKAGKKFIIGITGFIKSGKSLVAKYLKRYGYYVIDVDKFAHSLYKKSTFLYKKIVKIFGNDILKNNLIIDRKRLAIKIFSDLSIYKKFCSVVYPVLNKALIKKLKSIKHKIVILDMAVLFETGIYKKVDCIILIMVSKKKWLSRINNLPDAELIKKIFMYQNIFKLSKKIALSNFIIYNNNNRKQLYKMIGDLWKRKIIKMLRMTKD